MSAPRARGLAALLVAALVTTLLGGCAAAVIGTGVAVGAGTAADRRSTGTFIDDEIIELKAGETLRSDPQVPATSHVNITSYNNVVLLTGEVPDENVRTRAGKRVESIPKVRRVHNELAVSASSSMMARSNDSLLTGKVKTGIAQLSLEMAARVKVVTEAGTVYLLGLVSRAESAAITEVARKISGVRRVVKVFEYLD